MALRGFAGLPAGARLLVDSAPVAYILDGHPLGSEFAPVFAAAEAGEVQLYVTPITLAEVVAGPFGHGRDAQGEQYKQALTHGPGFTFVPLGDDAALMAARFRHRYRLKLPDAFQVAACILNGCDALMTHDRDFRRIKEVTVVDVA